MIYTCTLNPSLDYFLEVNDFQLGQLNRMKTDKKMPGGKGVNVSRVLRRLGAQSVALGFIGGFTGDFIRRQLISENIDTDFVEVDGDTRINVKIKSREETEINGLAPAITDEQVDELLLKLNRLNDRDILVLSGSVPETLSADIYKQMMQQIKDQNVKVIVDTSGPALREAVAARPFLIKPNQSELGGLFNTDISSIEEAVIYAKKLIDEGAENVIVSMGGKGSLLVNRETAVYAEAPRGEVKNSVGAGDSLVGGFLFEYARNGDYIEAFRYGTASGSATAFSVDLCSKEDTEALLPKVKIHQI
ncbi:1-phosphofructokinase [Scopulibacillus daqui]|uniref:Tagatose-6-phosphate kinase n=1 Tax=Scopulibacillus daqui TaxID=1469162 RepID=A0ABS2Q304_9BACL|nr:1-phosphofructokinase [Scopulibacillus daqui]MBM7646681.1 1-phosphofructokinase [Scopulibacillus daqui]